MSHFTVLVVTNSGDEAELKAALQPFHEYECTGTQDEYVVWVTDEDETIREEWATKTDDYWVKDGEILKTYDERFYREFTEAEVEKHGPLNMMGCGCGGGRSWDSRDWGDGKGYRTKIKMTDEEIEALGYKNVDLPISEGHTYECIEDYAKDYYGYEIRNGKFGRYTNPNAEWDWWQVGGRWSNKLMLKDGTRVDDGPKGYMDFETPQDEAGEKAGAEWDAKHAVIAGRELITFDIVREKHDGKIDEARDEYWAQPVLVELKAAFDDPFEEWPRFFVSREAFVEKARENAISTFAFLGTDGKWQQRGNMGWWGCVSDENDDWGKGFQSLLDTIADDQHIWVVDCHI